MKSYCIFTKSCKNRNSFCYRLNAIKCTVYLRKVTGSVTYTVKTGTLYYQNCHSMGSHQSNHKQQWLLSVTSFRLVSEMINHIDKNEVFCRVGPHPTPRGIRPVQYDRVHPHHCRSRRNRHNITRGFMTTKQRQLLDLTGLDGGQAHHNWMVI